MEDDVNKNLSEEHFPRFGKVAVDMRFITAEQLTEALAEQAEDSFSDKPHRPIGKILFEHGWITRDEISFIVLRLFNPEDLSQWIFHSTC
jgi:hypothetical protein